MTTSAHSTTQPLAELVFALLADRGVDRFVVAPGSRSAPLTLAAARCPRISLRLVYDERSAAYTALGMAQQIGKPVGVICSSGTAALNFAPAVAEAFYQRIPLIAITADRPPEWIDQSDNQAIRQNRLYEPHVRASFTMPVDDGGAETRWHAARIVADAASVANSIVPGPVHINFPLREPLYTHSMPEIPAGDRLRTAPMRTDAELASPEYTVRRLTESWRKHSRKLIVAGQLPPDDRLRSALTVIAADPTVAIIGDVTANLAGLGASHGWEAAIQSKSANALAPLLPSLVVWIGGQVTSRRIKEWLRQNPPAEFWRVDPERPAADAFQLNTMVVPVTAATFFEQLLGQAEKSIYSERDAYAEHWAKACKNAIEIARPVIEGGHFGELAATGALLAALPEGSHLQIGNSMPIRLVNLLGIDPANAPRRVDSNRGVSGIDGTVSTAVGATSTTDQITALIVGDLGFFYDRNGLWQRDLPPNLRIVLLNNHGGGIFDVINGPDTLPEEERRLWFLTPQPLSAQRTAEDMGLTYLYANDRESFTSALGSFFVQSDCPALLEFESDMATNSATWRAVMAALRKRQ